MGAVIDIPCEMSKINLRAAPGIAPISRSNCRTSLEVVKSLRSHAHEDSAAIAPAKLMSDRGLVVGKLTNTM